MNKNLPGGGYRNSSIELFRIITMLFIIAHHYVVNSGVLQEISQINVMQTNSLFALLFGWGGKTGINCFMLITGYFMCKNSISFRKFLKIFLVIEFYEIFIYFIFCITYYEPFNFKGLVKTVFPFYYMNNAFYSAYLVLFLFIPFLNLLIKAMNEKQHRYLIGLSLTVGSLLETFFKTSNAFTYVGWFMVLYFIAAYIRLASDGDYKYKWLQKKYLYSKKIWGWGTIACLLLSWSSVVAGAVIFRMTGKNIIYYFVSDSNKLLAVATALSAFLFFRNLNLSYSKIINTVAASTFGVLMIHANSDAMRRWLWKDILNNSRAFQSRYFIIHAVVSVGLVYILCSLLDMARIKFIEKPFFKWFDKNNKKQLEMFHNFFKRKRS